VIGVLNQRCGASDGARTCGTRTRCSTSRCWSPTRCATSSGGTVRTCRTTRRLQRFVHRRRTDRRRGGPAVPDLRRGQFHRSEEATPYFQTGETKYGKPIIDRVITRDTPLSDAAKCVLVSFDLTMRSNLSVGMPIDLICYESDSLEGAHAAQVRHRGCLISRR
jgi:hypothetical protein